MDDDAALAARLELLGNMLGERITMIARPHTPDNEVAAPLVDPENDLPQEGGRAPSQTPNESGDALPEKIVSTDSVPIPAQTFQPLNYVVQAFDCSQFHVGEPQNERFEFCPWSVIQSYPDCFIGNTNRRRARPFFNQILQGRVWDFFYVHDLREPYNKPYLLVPTAQFSAFLVSVNKTLGTSLVIPEGLNAERFTLRFGSELPRPRYLMRNRDTKTLEIEDWPRYRNDDLESYRKAIGIAQQDYEENMNIMARTPRYNTDKSRAKRRKAWEKVEKGARMLKDAQTFLALDGFYSTSDPVLVCFDVEAVELAPHPVSEIGIAILDVEEVRNTAAGPCGRDWWPMVRAYHLRTKEYSGVVNHRYIKGCPAAFDFGISTFPTMKNLASETMCILKPYVDSSRQLVLVGHDFDQDVAYLSQVGIDVMNLPNVISLLDSQVLHQCWRDLDRGRGLHAVLAELCIPNKNLHNAGNDAVFTLRATVGMAIEQIRECEANEKGEKYEPALWTA